jgi:hypothetical protein
MKTSALSPEPVSAQTGEALRLPNHKERGMNVAGPGQLSMFGFVVPKEGK